MSIHESEQLNFQVYFKDLSAVQTASKLYSPSNNYLQLTVLDQYLKVGLPSFATRVTFFRNHIHEAR